MPDVVVVPSPLSHCPWTPHNPPRHCSGTNRSQPCSARTANGSDLLVMPDARWPVAERGRLIARTQPRPPPRYCRPRVRRPRYDPRVAIFVAVVGGERGEILLELLMSVVELIELLRRKARPPRQLIAISTQSNTASRSKTPFNFIHISFTIC